MKPGPVNFVRRNPLDWPHDGLRAREQGAEDHLYRVGSDRVLGPRARDLSGGLRDEYWNPVGKPRWINSRSIDGCFDSWPDWRGR